MCYVWHVQHMNSFVCKPVSNYTIIYVWLRKELEWYTVNSPCVNVVLLIYIAD